MSNLEFDFSVSKPAIVFKENLSPSSKLIHHKALLRAQRYLVAEAELLEIIIEIDKAKIYEKFGLTHLTPYCIKHLGLSQDVAANFVRVARKSIHVPELKEAIDQGTLSVTKARTIVSVITKENHELWIKKAKTLTKDKLEKDIATAFPYEKRAERVKIQSHDRVRVEFDLTQEEMQLFRRVQDLVSQKIGESASLARTQAELLKVYLEKNDPLKKAERVAKKAAIGSIARDSAVRNSGDCSSGDCNQSQDLSRTAESWTAESEVIHPQRKKLAARTIHAVNLRDKGQCQAQLPDGSMCGHTRWLHFHHIVPVVKGGSDTAENLTTLCSTHHRLWHEIDS